MKSQRIYTKALTLGPFLTLIVLSSPAGGAAARKTARPETSEEASFPYGNCPTQEEVFSTKPDAVAPAASLGPFLKLILASGGSQPQSERSQAGTARAGERAPLALSGSYQGVPRPGNARRVRGA